MCNSSIGKLITVTMIREHRHREIQTNLYVLRHILIEWFIAVEWFIKLRFTNYTSHIMAFGIVNNQIGRWLYHVQNMESSDIGKNVIPYTIGICQSQVQNIQTILLDDGFTNLWFHSWAIPQEMKQCYYGNRYSLQIRKSLDIGRSKYFSFIWKFSQWFAQFKV